MTLDYYQGYLRASSMSYEETRAAKTSISGIAATAFRFSSRSQFPEPRAARVCDMKEKRPLAHDRRAFLFSSAQARAN
jgi:hypothetical protein